MQTRSSSRLVSNPSLNPTLSTNPNPKGRNHRRSKQRIENFNLKELSPPIVTMADQRTMAQLLQASTEGYEDAIVVPAITADNFELKHGLFTLVQNKQFFGHDKEDLHAHVRYFNKITSTLKFLNDDLVLKFINQLFPPSKTTNLRNEITDFHQRFDESFSEAWDRFKDLLRACPYHDFSKLNQIDTFYNALYSKDQDSLNSTVGGNFLDKIPHECLSIIESKSKVHYLRNKPVVAKVSTYTSTSGISPDIAELKDMVKALLLDKKSQNQSPAPVKAVEESCVTCDGTHSYRNCPATDDNVYRDNIQEFVSQAFAVNYNQGNTSYRPPMMSNQIRPPAYQAPAYQALALQTQGVSKEDFSAYVKANDAVMRNMQTQGQNMQNQLTNLTDLITKFVNSNSASTSSSENEPEATKGTMNPTNNENTEDVQPQVVQSESLIMTSKPVISSISEPAIAPVSASKPNLKASIPYPSRRNDERNHEKANNQIEKFYQIFKDMSFEISFADALILMPKFASTLKALIGNKEKLSLPDLTPTCMTLKLSDRLISRSVGVAEDVYVKVGSFHFPIDFVVVDFDADLRVPSILRRSFLKTGRALIDMFEGDLTFRVGKEAITFNLDQTLRYLANYSDITAKRIDVIDMACEEYSQEVLGFSDTISSGNPTPFYDLIVSTTFPTLTPFENSDFLLEEVDAFLAIEDELTSSEFYQPYLNPERDILLLEAFLNDDPSLPPPNQRNYVPEVRKELKICEAKSDKSSVDEPQRLNSKIYLPTSNMHSWKVTISYRIGRKRHSPARTERLLIVACLLGYEMLQARFRERMLKRCEDTNLCLNWEKSHFMVKEGIVLGHKISKQGIEVDKAKEFTFKVIDTKRAENLAADHLSRLENPHQNVLDPKEINESFPLETINSGFYSWKLLKSSRLVIMDPQEVTMAQITQPERAIISDRGMHFCKDQFTKVMQKYGVTHRLATPYHLQTSGQVKVSNRGLKRILERAVGENCASWSDKLDDALWAFRTAYKTLIGCTPYKLVYRKACHFPVELEHKAYLDLKYANFDLKTACDHRKVQINELNELRDQANENSLIYKEKTKRLHDSKIKNRVFNIGDRVLL
nr:reverse transcriptase domain-containing protein [Tanacetum cinerariifolium]